MVHNTARVKISKAREIIAYGNQPNFIEGDLFRLSRQSFQSGE